MSASFSSLAFARISSLSPSKMMFAKSSLSTKIAASIVRSSLVSGRTMVFLLAFAFALISSIKLIFSPLCKWILTNLKQSCLKLLTFSRANFPKLFLL